MDKARVGVIGAGWWGTVGHIEPLSQDPECELVAVYSRSEDKARERAEKYGIAHYYSDYRRMIDECPMEGVVIATTPNVHYEQARYALEHGLHVLMEKPFVLHADEAEDLARLARERGLILTVCHPLLYLQPMSEMRALIRDQLGRLLLVSAVFSQRVYDLYKGNVPAMFGHRAPDYPQPNNASYSDPSVAGGGEGHAQASHILGAVLWLTGLRPENVFAYMNSLDVAVDVVDSMVVRFEGGALGTVSANGLLPPWCYANHVHVQGENGVLHLDAAGRVATVRLGDEKQPRVFDAANEGYPRDALTRNYVRALLGREEMLTPMEVAIDEVRILDAAYRSAASGQPEAVRRTL